MTFRIAVGPFNGCSDLVRYFQRDLNWSNDLSEELYMVRDASQGEPRYLRRDEFLAGKPF